MLRFYATLSIAKSRQHGFITALPPAVKLGCKREFLVRLCFSHSEPPTLFESKNQAVVPPIEPTKRGLPVAEQGPRRVSEGRSRRQGHTKPRSLCIKKKSGLSATGELRPRLHGWLRTPELTLSPPKQAQHGATPSPAHLVRRATEKGHPGDGASQHPDGNGLPRHLSDPASVCTRRSEPSPGQGKPTDNCEIHLEMNYGKNKSFGRNEKSTKIFRTQEEVNPADTRAATPASKAAFCTGERTRKGQKYKHAFWVLLLFFLKSSKRWLSKRKASLIGICSAPDSEGRETPC